MKPPELKVTRLQDRIAHLEATIARRREIEEMALRESEERYRSLFKNNHSIMLLIDPLTADIVDANPAACAFYGYSEKALTCQRMTDIKAHGRSEVVGRLARARTERQCPLFFKHRLSDGSTRDVEIYSGPIRIDGRELLYAIVHDVTERKLAEAALTRSNETLNNILSTSPVAIGLAEDRVFEWANDTMLEMFGFEDERDFRCQSARIIYPTEKEFQRVGDIVYRNLAKGAAAETDALFIRKDRSTFIGHLKIASPDPNQPTKRTIFTISDESWRICAENERILKEKLEGVLELAGAICHELNQPLMAIGGYCELLLLQTQHAPPSPQKLHNIIEQVERMKEIMTKLMNITRYETKNYVPGKKIIDIERASGTRSP